jgi:putative Mg2+ transporter-C (MgtC) family protein
MAPAVIDSFDNAIRTWGAGLNWPAEELLRLMLAAVAGGLVGIEREVRGRQAGFRTNLLVAVGSALVMIVSISFVERRWFHGGEINVNVDPARIAYGVMTGIGFLCAGTIIKHEASVRGLTTAAAIWCVAAIGMAAGFGMYTVTALATAVVVGALWILDYVEDAIPKTHHRVLVIRRAWGPGCVVETIKKLKDAGLKVNGASFERTDDLASVDITIRTAFKNRQVYYALERQLEDDDHFELMAAREE